VSFGFGSAIDEPVTVWRADTGELSGGTYSFAVMAPPPTVDGVGARYLAVTPPTGQDPVALLVTPSCQGGVPQYAGSPTEISPHGFFTYLVDDPNDAAFLTPAQWGGTVNITGITITPSTTYDVQTESTEGVVSATGTGTTWLWGDVNNDGSASFLDVQLVILAFGGNFDNATFAGADLALPIMMGCFSADRIINTNDTSAAIKAFQSVPYPCLACP